MGTHETSGRTHSDRHPVPCYTGRRGDAQGESGQEGRRAPRKSVGSPRKGWTSFRKRGDTSRRRGTSSRKGARRSRKSWASSRKCAARPGRGRRRPGSVRTCPGAPFEVRVITGRLHGHTSRPPGAPGEACAGRRPEPAPDRDSPTRRSVTPVSWGARFRGGLPSPAAMNLGAGSTQSPGPIGSVITVPSPRGGIRIGKRFTDPFFGNSSNQIAMQFVVVKIDAAGELGTSQAAYRGVTCAS
jgi:hypothetical protein